MQELKKDIKPNKSKNLSKKFDSDSDEEDLPSKIDDRKPNFLMVNDRIVKQYGSDEEKSDKKSESESEDFIEKPHLCNRVHSDVSMDSDDMAGDLYASDKEDGEKNRVKFK